MTYSHLQFSLLEEAIFRHQNPPVHKKPQHFVNKIKQSKLLYNIFEIFPAKTDLVTRYMGVGFLSGIFSPNRDDF